jgi:exonuclease III
MDNSLRTVLWNANGLTNHKLELQTSLNTHKIDHTLISETHFTTKTLFRMPNYKVYHIPHPEDRAHGGAAVIMRNSISHYELIHHQNNKIQADSVKVDVKSWPLALSAVYCPPRHAISSKEYVNLPETYGSPMGSNINYT